MGRHIQHVAEMKTLMETKKLTNDGMLSLETYSESSSVSLCVCACVCACVHMCLFVHVFACVWHASVGATEPYTMSTQTAWSAEKDILLNLITIQRSFSPP